MWCIQKKGPLFVAMFNPLGVAIAALMSAVFLGDTIHLGRYLYLSLSFLSTIIIFHFFKGPIGKTKEMSPSMKI